MTAFPTGAPVTDRGPAQAPSREQPLSGAHVRLVAPEADRDAGALYDATRDNADPGQWTYMSFGPFADRSDMLGFLTRSGASRDPLFVTVMDEHDHPVGMAAYQRFQPAHRTIELGNIFYVPSVRRTPVNTEAIYLMLKACFDWGYRRVEWKCDALNRRSINAALRLGFSFEGIFQQHYIVRGHNRDTAWFAMLDKEWPALRANFEAVLYDPQCTSRLSELTAPRVRRGPLNNPADP